MTISLTQTTIDVALLADGDDLVAVLRAENERPAVAPPCWALLGERVSLLVGVHGDVGTLAWCGPDAVGGMEVPTGGSNEHEVEYRLGGLYPQPFPPRSEIPIEEAFAAVGEFLATGGRPTGVRWLSDQAAWSEGFGAR